MPTPAPKAVPAPVPQVSVSPVGTLKLPYSPAWSQALLQNLDEFNNELIGIKAEEDQADIEYAQEKRVTAQELDQGKRTTLNTNAAKGTALSSGYGTGLQAVASAYLNKLNGLETSHTAKKQNFNLQRSGLHDSFKRQTSVDALKYAEELQKKAGTLGLGRQQAKPIRPKPKPKPKPKPRPKGKSWEPARPRPAKHPAPKGRR